MKRPPRLPEALLETTLPEGQIMVSALFGSVTLDAFIFVLFALVLTAVALVAGYIPARRALSVDPILALRAE